MTLRVLRACLPQERVAGQHPGRHHEARRECSLLQLVYFCGQIAIEGKRVGRKKRASRIGLVLVVRGHEGEVNPVRAMRCIREEPPVERKCESNHALLYSMLEKLAHERWTSVRWRWRHTQRGSTSKRLQEGWSTDGRQKKMKTAGSKQAVGRNMSRCSCTDLPFPRFFDTLSFFLFFFFEAFRHAPCSPLLPKERSIFAFTGR